MLSLKGFFCERQKENLQLWKSLRVPTHLTLTNFNDPLVWEANALNLLGALQGKILVTTCDPTLLRGKCCLKK